MQIIAGDLPWEPPHVTDTADRAETTDAPPRSKALGTSLGVAAFVLAIATTVVWFQKVRAVAMPEDTTLFVVAFLAAPVLGLAAFVIGTRWFGGVPPSWACSSASSCPSR